MTSLLSFHIISTTAAAAMKLGLSDIWSRFVVEWIIDGSWPQIQVLTVALILDRAYVDEFRLDARCMMAVEPEDHS